MFMKKKHEVDQRFFYMLVDSCGERLSSGISVEDCKRIDINILPEELFEL